MILIRRYLFRSIIATLGLVLGVLLSLGVFIEFVGQLDDTGVGDYGIMQALFFAVLKMPDMAFGMLPMATLLAAMLALGALASNSEFIVMRAAGVSVGRLALAVGATGAGLAVFALLLGEFIAPPLDNYARQFRTMVKHGQTGIRLGQGAWVRDGDTLILLGPQGEDFSYGGVYMFRLDGPRLSAIARADSAEIDETNQWVLNNYQQTRFTDEGVVVEQEGRAIQPYSLNAEILSLMVVRSSSLTGAGLYRYIRYLRSNGLDSTDYEMSFWSRIASGVSVLPMCLLALPFAFRNLRSSSTGARLVVGVIIGLVYFLISQTLADGGTVLQIEPFVVAWLPVVLLSVAVFVMLRRVR